MVFILVLGLLFSCEDDVGLERCGLLGSLNPEIIGVWVEEGYEDDALVLNSAAELDQNKYGFVLHEDGSFVERKNSGWCATPPISYANYDGRWRALSDSLLDIVVGYWGGSVSYQIRILGLDDKQLRIRYLYGEERENTR